MTNAGSDSNHARKPIEPESRSDRRRVIRHLTLGGLTALAISATLVIGGCERASRDSSGEFHALRIGGKEVQVQLAVTPPEQQRGLMGRTDLGPDQGMIFIYAEPKRMSFWMKSTPTPLDIGFFTPEGTLLEVHPLEPFDENAVASRGTNVQFALEMNRGWYARNGVGPGSKLELSGLRKAMIARGFDLGEYQLQ